MNILRQPLNEVKTLEKFQISTSYSSREVSISGILYTESNKFWELSGKGSFGAITFRDQLHKEKKKVSISFKIKRLSPKKGRKN